jgi:hypothetical protein
LCFQYSEFFEFEEDTIRIRFRFMSDSIPGDGEGWMIDNMMLMPTYIHTVAELSEDKVINVFPNPADTRISVEVNKAKVPHVVETVELFAANGRLIKRFTPASLPFSVDVSDVRAGHYLLRVKTNIIDETHRIIIQD